MTLRDFERPSSSDRAWSQISLGYPGWKLFGAVGLLIWIALFDPPPHTEFTSVRLGENVEDRRTTSDIRAFVSGSNVGIFIAYNYGNGNRLEVVLADRNGKAFDGFASTCSKYVLNNQSGEYHCAFLALPPGKYEIVTWLSGQFKEKYPFEVNTPAPATAPHSVGQN